MKRAVYNIIIVITVTIIIAFPVSMAAIASITGKSYDVPLLGYTDSIADISFSGQNFWNGSFQSSYSSGLDSSLPLRGCIVRTYNTIRYKLFRVGNRPIGKNGSVFETEYLNLTNCIGRYDYSYPEKDTEMQNMVNHMVSVNNKLNLCGKKMLVYVAPSKTRVYPQDMPAKFVSMKKETSINAVDLFRDKITNTDLPNVFCVDYVQKLDYPAFYPTGIHWSRTYEQISSRNIISSLSELTGKKYRNIVLSEVEESKNSFWRDTDVYDLLNVWSYPDITFYQYNTEVPERDGYDNLNILIYGDSFAKGLIKDVSENLPEDRITFLSRDDEVYDFMGRDYLLYDDWNNLDWQYYLDCADVIVVEFVEPEIVNYTFNFLEYLDSYLDTYTPNPRSSYYMDFFDGNSSQPPIYRYDRGIYEKENGFAWLRPSSSASIKADMLSEEGLEIQFAVPEQVFRDATDDHVKIYVNGKTVFEKTYKSAEDERIVVHKDILGEPIEGGYSVEFLASQSFCPSLMGESSDDRELALRLEYLGGVR